MNRKNTQGKQNALNIVIQKFKQRKRVKRRVQKTLHNHHQLPLHILNYDQPISW